MDKKELISEIAQVIDMGLPDHFIEEHKLTSEEPNYEYAERILDDYVQKQVKEETLRLMADFDNYKKRQEKQRETLRGNISYEIFSGIFQVLDDWEFFRNVVSDTDDKDVSSGFNLIDKKMLRFLESNNVEKVETDVMFDPDLHECVTTMDEGKESGTILKVVSNGYKINGKIYKHPKVIVQK